MDGAAEGAPQQHYMAIYTMETDNPRAAVERLTALVQSGIAEMSEAFSMEDMAIQLYEAITPRVDVSVKGTQHARG